MSDESTKPAQITTDAGNGASSEKSVADALYPEVKTEPSKDTAGKTVETKTDEKPPEKSGEKSDAKVEADKKPETKGDQKDATVVPEKYEFKLPKDSPISTERIDKISALAKKAGLTNEEAQSLVDSEHESITSFVEGQKKEVETKIKTWADEAAKDKEYGGSQFKENAALAHRVIQRFASDDLRKTLDDTGLGNHPELLRTFYRIGKAMAEDKLIHSKAQVGPQKKSIEDIFYPTESKTT